MTTQPWNKICPNVRNLYQLVKWYYVPNTLQRQHVSKNQISSRRTWHRIVPKLRVREYIISLLCAAILEHLWDYIRYTMRAQDKFRLSNTKPARGKWIDTAGHHWTKQNKTKLSFCKHRQYNSTSQLSLSMTHGLIFSDLRIQHLHAQSEQAQLIIIEQTNSKTRL